MCEPVFDYGRVPATWTIVDDGGHVADATGGDVTVRLQTDLTWGSRAAGPGAVTSSSRVSASARYLVGPDSPPGRCRRCPGVVAQR